jgi:eukaryotic-like serine/threonine-protein kinase
MWLSDRVLDHVCEAVFEPDLSRTKYRLERALGRGGMAAVYVATDAELGREVAVKVSSATDGGGELCARLRREAQIIAQLEHPGIVPVHDVGVLPDGRVYYVMKLVRGERLDRWLEKNRDLRAALRVFQRICEAVGFAHARGTIHRDLKPDNVMVGAFGEALVMDWGVAKTLSKAIVDSGAGDLETSHTEDVLGDTLPAESPPGSTLAGTVIGTPSYMAPEQARGDVGTVDARSDVYALGAVLYFVLARKAPFDGPDVLRRVREAPPTPLRDVDAEIPLALISICSRAMAKSSSERYATALEVADEIGRFLDAAPVLAHREGPIERVARFASRNRVILSLLAAYLLLRVALLAFSK